MPPPPRRRPSSASPASVLQIKSHPFLRPDRAVPWGRGLGVLGGRPPSPTARVPGGVGNGGSPAGPRRGARPSSALSLSANGRAMQSRRATRLSSDATPNPQPPPTWLVEEGAIATHARSATAKGHRKEAVAGSPADSPPPYTGTAPLASRSNSQDAQRMSSGAAASTSGRLRQKLNPQNFQFEYPTASSLGGGTGARWQPLQQPGGAPEWETLPFIAARAKRTASLGGGQQPRLRTVTLSPILLGTQQAKPARRTSSAQGVREGREGERPASRGSRNGADSAVRPSCQDPFPGVAQSGFTIRKPSINSTPERPRSTVANAERGSGGCATQGPQAAPGSGRARSSSSNPIPSKFSIRCVQAALPERQILVAFDSKEDYVCCCSKCIL